MISAMRSAMLAAVLAGAVGCESTQRIFYQAGQVRTAEPLETVALASDEGGTVPPAVLPRPALRQAPATQPATQPTTQSTNRQPYTAPGQAFQGAGLLAAAAFGAVPSLSGAGKEAAENVSLASPTVFGRAGLDAPTPVYRGVIVSRPGIQQGPATGLGFGSTTHSIFRPSINRFSGAGGACERLTQAGFFRGDSPVCQRQFQARRP